LKGGVTGIYRSSYIRKESHNMYFILNIWDRQGYDIAPRPPKPGRRGFVSKIEDLENEWNRKYLSPLPPLSFDVAFSSSFV
jgi:hypothetical protein